MSWKRLRVGVGDVGGIDDVGQRRIVEPDAVEGVAALARVFSRPRPDLDVTDEGDEVGRLFALIAAVGGHEADDR